MASGRSRSCWFAAASTLLASQLVAAACSDDTPGGDEAAPSTAFPLPTFFEGPFASETNLFDAGVVDGAGWQVFIDEAQLDSRFCVLAVVFQGDRPSSVETQIVSDTRLSCYASPQIGLAHPEPIVWGTSPGSREPRVLVAHRVPDAVANLELLADGEVIDPVSDVESISIWVVQSSGPYSVRFDGSSAERHAVVECSLADAEVEVLLGDCSVVPG